MPVPKGSWAYQRRLAKEGFDTGAIAARLMRRFGCRPRTAWRLAHGWSQTQAAEHYNARFGNATRAPMAGTRLSAYERWPEGGERPSVTTLRRLAELYQARPGDLLDDLDLDHLPEADQPSYRKLLQQPRPDSGHQSPALHPLRSNLETNRWK